MKRLITILALLLATYTFGQNGSGRVSLFLDCNTFCDQTYMRTELSQFDFLRDRLAADVHILITSQRTGSGGREYQLLFYGNNQYEDLNDTIQFSNSNIATNFEIRERLVKHIRIGIIPYLVRNDQTDLIDLSFKKTQKSDDSTNLTHDPWNYWVINFGGNGNLNSDQNYFSRRLSGNINTNQITDARKILFRFNVSDNRQEFTFDDTDSTTTVEVVKRNSYNFEHTLVWSWGKHMAYGYELGISSSTFSNFKQKIYISPTIEYNVFPYSDVNNKLFTIRYGLAIQKNIYNDSTIYDRIDEVLYSQYLSAGLQLTQKWGTVYSGLRFTNYFHDYKDEDPTADFFYNIGLETFTNVRITGGLSFRAFVFAGIVNDQIYLPKGSVSEQDVLTRRRQLQSNFNIFANFGFNYRFGSKLNNFVNPRFGSDGFD